MNRLIVIVLCMMSLCIGACGNAGHKTTGSQPAATDSTKTAEVYYCAMDCEGKGKTYTHEGECPYCGMDLQVKITH